MCNSGKLVKMSTHPRPLSSFRRNRDLVKKSQASWSPSHNPSKGPGQGGILKGNRKRMICLLKEQLNLQCTHKATKQTWASRASSSPCCSSSLDGTPWVAALGQWPGRWRQWRWWKWSWRWWRRWRWLLELWGSATCTVSAPPRRIDDPQRPEPVAVTNWHLVGGSHQ